MSQKKGSFALAMSGLRLVALFLGFILFLGILDHSLDLSSARAAEVADSHLGVKLLPRILPAAKQTPHQLLSARTILLKVFCPPLSTFDLGRNIIISCHLTVGYGCTDLSPPTLV